MRIVIILSRSEMGTIEKIIFLLLLLGIATSLDIAMGNENVAIVINNVNVGVIKLYNPMPSTPIYLVIIIFKIKPSSFERKPPVSRISVDIAKLLFNSFLIIINCMKRVN